ncbi:12644_t:CDS:1, partial [Funneliformis caledonium]
NLLEISLFVDLSDYPSLLIETITDYCPLLTSFSIKIRKEDEIPKLFYLMKNSKNLKFLYILFSDFIYLHLTIKKNLKEFAQYISSTLVTLDISKWLISFKILENFLENLYHL